MLLFRRKVEMRHNRTHASTRTWLSLDQVHPAEMKNFRLGKSNICKEEIYWNSFICNFVHRCKSFPSTVTLLTLTIFTLQKFPAILRNLITFQHRHCFSSNQEFQMKNFKYVCPKLIYYFEELMCSWKGWGVTPPLFPMCNESARKLIMV